MAAPEAGGSARGSAPPHARAAAVAGCCSEAPRSLYASLCSRELQATQVRKRPFVGDLSSSFGGTGNGVLAFLSTHSFVPAPPFAVRFAQRPENSHLCLAVDEDGSVRIVDTSAPLPATWDERYEYAPLALWTAHDNAVFDAAWTSGDTSIVTASGDQRARLWDVATQQLVASLRGHAGSIKSVSVRPDAPWAIATGARDGNFCLWDTRAAPQPVARSNSLHILPAALYASAHEPPVTSRRRSRVAVPPPVSVTCVAFLQDSGALATGGDRDATVRIWDARNLAAPAALAQAERRSQRSRGVTAMAVSPDGSRLLAAYADSTMCLFDSARPSIGPTAQFSGHAATSFYVKVAFAHDGTHVASGSCDKMLYIWQVDRPDDGPYALEGHGGEVTGLDWSAGDFGRMASCADDGSLRVWAVRRPDELPRRVLPRRERAAPRAAAPRAEPLPPVRVEVHGDDSAAAFDTPAAAMARAASWPEVVLLDAPMPDAPMLDAVGRGDAADEQVDAPPPVAAEAEQLPPPAGALPQAPPMQEEAAPGAAQRKVQSRAITDFFSPVRPPLAAQTDCVNAGAGPSGTPEARVA